MILHPLFHWAPTMHRDSITERGLVPSSEPTCSSQAYPYICCCMSPSHAWALSAQSFPEGATTWDLWQVVLNPDNAVEVLPIWGNRLEEIRIHATVKPDQLWLVGTRSVAQENVTDLLLSDLTRHD